MDERQVEQVRRFNRALTRRIGVLDDNYLGRGRPLAESRLLFEIGRDGVDVRELRRRLALDSGYLSRMLRALEQQGLLQVRPAPHDARVRELVRADPDATLAELRQRLGLKVSLSTLCEYLRRIELSFKKR